MRRQVLMAGFLIATLVTTVSLSPQELRVESTTYVFRGSAPGLQRVVVSLNAELPLATPGAQPADVTFTVRDVRDGHLAASGRDTMTLPEASRPGASTGTGHYHVQLELPAGAYVMRVVVREPGGRLGSADRRFTVHALDGQSMSASDLVVGTPQEQTWPVQPTVYTSDVLSAVFEIYGRSPDQLKAVTADIDLLAPGSITPTISTRAELDPITPDKGGASRRARIELPLRAVPPGPYVVRATVRGGHEAAVELLRDVAVSASAPPAPPAPPPVTGLDPTLILQGDLARSYIALIRGRADGPLQRAADLAQQGSWDAVEAALPATAPPAGAAGALRGFARFARRDFAGAASAWKACLDAHPQDGRIAFLLGWAEAASGDDRAAVSAWRAAVRADPAMVPAYLALADAYVRLGRPALALRVIRSGLAAMPDSVELHDQLLRLERK